MHQETTEERKALTPKLKIVKPIRRLPEVEAPNPYSELLKNFLRWIEIHKPGKELNQL